MSSQTSVTKKTYKLSPIITPVSLVMFEKNFRNSRGDYGLAGEELCTGIPYDRSLELKRPTFVERVQQDDGSITETVKPWNKYAEAGLAERNKSKVIQNRDYDKFVGPLWKDFHEVISHNVLDRVKSDDKNKYEKAQRDLNNLHLLQLVRQACHGLNRNRIKTLQADWDKYYQNEQRFETFVVKHEEKKDALVSAGKVITDNEFCVHLRDHTNVAFGQAAVPEAYNTSPEDPNFVSYGTFRKKCWESAQSMSVIQGQVPKDTVKDDNGKKGQPKGQGNPKKQGEKRAPEDAMAVMSAKVASLEKQLSAYTSGKKQKTGNGKDTKPDAAITHMGICWNCEGNGHPFFKCAGEKATCSKCKAKGHCAKFHDEWKAHMDRRAAAKEEREKNSAPVAQSKSVKIAPEEEAIPVAHSKSLRVMAEPARSTVIERGTIGNYLQAATIGRTFSVRIAPSDSPSDAGTAVDSHSGNLTPDQEPTAMDQAVATEQAVSTDVFIAQMEEYLVNTAPITSVNPESVPAALEDGEVNYAEPNLTEEAPSAAAEEGEHSDAGSISHRDDFSVSDSGSIKSTEEDNGGNYKKVIGKRSKKHDNPRESSDETSVAVTRSRSNSRNPSPGKNKNAAVSSRKSPAHRSPSQAAGKKYVPSKGTSPSDQSSVEVLNFPYLSKALSVFPPRSWPVTEEQKMEQQLANERHFEIDTNNRDGLFKYYAAIFKKFEFIEALIALTNNMPYLGKATGKESGTKVSASVQAARKACAHNYRKFVDSKAVKDKYPTLGKIPHDPVLLNDQAKWFSELHDAALKRAVDLRSMSGCIDEMFESERGRGFWEELTGMMDPILPWSMLSQTWLTGGEQILINVASALRLKKVIL